MMKRHSLQIFRSVIKALFLREIGMRMSVSKSGLFWTFAEPFFQVFVFAFIHAIIFIHKNKTYDYIVFIALNFTAYNLFKNIIIKGMNSFSANKALFLYKQVKPIDTIIARALVELFLSGIIIIIFVILAFYFNYQIYPKNLPLVAFGFLWLFIFAIGVANLLAVLNIFYPSIGKIINVSMMFLMFGSALFYTLDSVPFKVREFLLYNPLVHFMELIHGEFFLELSDKYVDFSYMLIWTLFVYFVGLILYRNLEKRIISL